MQNIPEKVGNFIIKKQINSGAFGSCYFAENIQTNEICCAKIVHQSETAKSEFEILSKISHPNIVTFINVEIYNNLFFIFMEFCEGLTLFDVINTYAYLSEEDAKYIFKQLMSALEYLHSRGISHGDIKLENIICNKKKKIKLIDFGFSTESEMKYRGSIYYSAPEIHSLMLFNGKISDMWSAGVCLFAMVTGYLPFQGKTIKEVIKKIKKKIVDFPSFISKETKYMIKSLLQYQPESRMTASEVLKDDWIRCEDKVCNAYDYVYDVYDGVNETNYLNIIVDNEYDSIIKAIR
jgi:serine/threonine protein kinase